jgi:hypothetical protein
MDKVNKIKIVLLSIICIIVFFIWGAREEHHLGRGFTYFESPGHVAYWKKGDTLHFDIPPKVLSYKNTWNTLLVKQHPRQYPHIEDTPYFYPYGRDTIYYFFVDKRSRTVTGPLLYSEMESFLQERDLSQMLHNLK